MGRFKKPGNIKVGVVGYGGAFNMGRSHLNEMKKAGMMPMAVAEIDPAIFAAEREKVQNDQRRAFEDWRLLLRAGFAEVVNRLRESLVPGPDGTTRKLTDASVERLKSFLETFHIDSPSRLTGHKLG